jgi:hypothetical protein
MKQHGADDLRLDYLKSELLNILSLLDRNPGIDAAADDLYASAQAFAAGTAPEARRGRLLTEAFLRFQNRVPGAS